MSIVCLCDEIENSENYPDKNNDCRSSFHRFLDNLSCEGFVDYLIRDGNHHIQIEDYFNLRDVGFLNEIVAEARLRCTYDKDVRGKLKRNNLGKFL